MKPKIAMFANLRISQLCVLGSLRKVFKMRSAPEFVARRNTNLTHNKQVTLQTQMLGNIGVQAM
jgi:hypothetical protein